ncbi:hypothetical protein ACFFX1_26640 [Dactylosporangium sucinum]|uniref:hypothetical protein n=1 Tax=Dactylosporangium sucinum TaxID=1424081 RepID=UPI00167ED28D|nr:hypothetical protein [Dactylosporangium sucinum]
MITTSDAATMSQIRFFRLIRFDEGAGEGGFVGVSGALRRLRRCAGIRSTTAVASPSVGHSSLGMATIVRMDGTPHGPAGRWPRLARDPGNR